MEQHASTEAWFVIAETIGGRTVEELQQAMSQLEFLHWCVHLKRRADEMKHQRGGGR